MAEIEDMIKKYEEQRNYCIGLKKDGNCSVLTKEKCDYPKCTFYKTPADKIRSEHYAKARCQNLGIVYGVSCWQEK